MDCSICHDTINQNDNIVITKCKHSFHSECLLKWAVNNNSCPLCRVKLYEKQLDEIKVNESNEFVGEFECKKVIFNERDLHVVFEDDSFVSLDYALGEFEYHENRVNNTNFDIIATLGFGLTFAFFVLTNKN